MADSPWSRLSMYEVELEPDVRRPNDLTPLRDFGIQVIGKSLRLSANRLCAEGSDAFRQFALCERTRERRIELRDEGGRRAGRSQYAPPGARLESRDRRLRDR